LVAKSVSTVGVVAGVVKLTVAVPPIRLIVTLVEAGVKV
jgi:hypothetical protein